MKDQARVVPMAAIGISLIAHLLFLLLVPYRAPRLLEPPAHDLVPVKLLELPPAPRARAVRRSTPRPMTPAVPMESTAPEPREAPLIEEAPPVEEAPHSREPPPIVPATVVGEPSAEKPASAASEHVAASASDAAVRSGAEIAAYKLILSTLRGRIVETIRYPAIARANGWEGTVIVAVRLDEAGRLEQAIVRQSSGHEILDRAAAALLKKVTPVANPLSQPVTIEIPIVYELK